MIRDNIKIIKSYFKLVKGNKILITCLFITSILRHIASLLIPIFAANIILYITDGNADKTYLNILLLACTYIAYNLFLYLNYVSYSYNFKYSYKNIREKIMNKVLTFDVDFNDNISKAEILNTINADTGSIAEMIDNISEIILVFIKVIILIFIFAYTNVLIGIIVLLLELLYLKSYDYCNVANARYLMGQQKYRDKLTDNLSQILNGLSEIKIFNIHNKMKQRFSVIANKWSEQYMLKRKYINIRATLLPLITDLGKIILYLILVYLVLKGYYEVNILVLLITYYENIITNTNTLMTYSKQIREWSISITRINKLLNYENGQKLEFGTNKKDNILGLVEFKDVSYTYKSKNKGSIKNISFEALPNEITALVGHSGCGKTTIVNLLLRKYKIDEGAIYIDGENIYDFTEDTYSKNITAVNQMPFIFTMSIRQNLNLIDKNKQHQIEACKRVGIHDFIMSLPKGYNTILAVNASNFSGGQRQLLSIARVLLSKAEILIFDEVTSSLDTILVEKMKEIFEDLKQDHTIIIITHKKDVMQIADNIIVLNKGEIVGIGTHDKLMKNNPFYIDLQTKNYHSSNKRITENILITDTDETKN